MKLKELFKPLITGPKDISYHLLQIMVRTDDLTSRTLPGQLYVPDHSLHPLNGVSDHVRKHYAPHLRK
jgi:hypothetical protein